MCCSKIPDLGLKCPEPIDLDEHLKRVLFTETQIKWIHESIKVITNNTWCEIESIAEFPLNHDYGFKRNGGIKIGSKYNLRISFTHEDRENKWSGKQSSSILFIKNNITLI